MPQQAVQAGHACIEAARTFRKNYNPHPHLIYLTVENEEQLNEALKTLSQTVKIRPWREPDRNNELTAICSEPINGDKRKLFRKFCLMKGEQIVIVDEDIGFGWTPQKARIRRLVKEFSKDKEL